MGGDTVFFQLAQHAGWNAQTLFNAIHDDSHSMKVVFKRVFCPVFGMGNTIAHMGHSWVFHCVWHNILGLLLFLHITYQKKQE